MSAIDNASAVAASRIGERWRAVARVRLHRNRYWLVAESLFVAGWSLIWAEGLGLAPFPRFAPAALLVLGLLCIPLAHRRNDAKARSREPPERGRH